MVFVSLVVIVMAMVIDAGMVAVAGVVENAVLCNPAQRQPTRQGDVHSCR